METFLFPAILRFGMKTDLVVGGCLVHDNKVLLIHHKKLNKWLPVGGHIDKDEIPDDAIRREFKEEVNLSIDLVDDMPEIAGKVKQLKKPIFVNLHNVGDHDHCCFYYLCTTGNLSELKINEDELLGFRWLSRQELEDLNVLENVPLDVRSIALLALDMQEKR